MPRAMWSAPRWPRPRCSRGARRRATPAAWSLASRWIRPRVRQSTACPRWPASGRPRNRRAPAASPYVVGRCDLATTARGAIAGHGGRLKLIFRADNRKLLGVHCIGDIASELVALGHMALHVGSTVELFLTLALNTPTYSAAYHDAAIDGLARLAELMGYDHRTAQRWLFDSEKEIDEPKRQIATCCAKKTSS